MTAPGPEAFPASYSEARARFREAAAAAGGSLEAFPIGQVGPGGEELTVDAARLGPASPDRLLILSSGLHGVEGPFGSAVQTAWLRQPDLAAGEGALLLHALNPYGFAWDRRFDEGNVDLNRNFLLPCENYSGAPKLYAKLDRLLNPRRPPRPGERFWFSLRARLAILRYGLPGVKSAVAQGQYDFPLGLFFGGHGPSRVNRLLAGALPEWVGDARRVVHLDFHTGLGAPATYRLLTAPGLTEAEIARLTRWFGAGVVEAGDPKGVAYPTRGDLAVWTRAQFPGRDYTYACAEFGTVPPVEVLAAIRLENQAHQWLPHGHPVRTEMKRQNREAYVPSDPAWRASVLAQSLRLIDQARAALAESPDGA